MQVKEKEEKEEKDLSEVVVFYSKTKYFSTLIGVDRIGVGVIEEKYRKMRLWEGFLCSIFYLIAGGLLLYSGGKNVFFFFGCVLSFLAFALNFLFSYFLPLILVLMWFGGKKFIFGIPYVVMGFICFYLFYLSLNYVLSGYVGSVPEKRGVVFFVPFYEKEKLKSVETKVQKGWEK